jgi:hypothetical protein
MRRIHLVLAAVVALVGAAAFVPVPAAAQPAATPTDPFAAIDDSMRDCVDP